MSQVKFAVKYQIRDNGDMDIFLVQTEPVTKKVKIVDIGGIKMLRGIPADPPLIGNLLFRVPSKMIVAFLGSMINVANDYAKRMEKLQELKNEGKI